MLQQTLPVRIHPQGSVCLRHLGEVYRVLYQVSTPINMNNLSRNTRRTVQLKDQSLPNLIQVGLQDKSLPAGCLELQLEAFRFFL